MILVVALLVMAFRPAPAEADPMVILAIAGAVVVVIIIVAYLIVANVHEQRQAMQDGQDTPVLIVYAPPPGFGTQAP